MDAVAQFDNASRAERTRLGKIRRVQSGMWHGGPPPFGYKLEKHKLVIDESEAKWVKAIFTEISKGKSSAQVKRMLDSNAVPTRRNKKTWSIGSIDALLKNTHYSGYYVFKDSKSQQEIQVQCPSIIDAATWAQVQHKREPNVNQKNRKNATVKNFYLLRDMMFCGHCGRGISGRVIRERNEFSYYCPSRERMWVKEGDTDEKWVRGRGCGFTRAMNLKQVNDLVWEFVKSLHANSSILKEEVRTRIYKENGVVVRSEEEFKALKSKLKTLQRNHVRMSETLGELQANRVLKELNDISFQTMTLRIQGEIREIEEQLERTRKEVEGASSGKKWNSWLKAFGGELEKLDSKTDEEKKLYLEGLISRIEVRWIEDSREHELTLHTHLPIINDGITWREKDKIVGKGRAAIRYDIYEGESKTTLRTKKKDGRG